MRAARWPDSLIGGCRVGVAAAAGGQRRVTGGDLQVSGADGGLADGDPGYAGSPRCCRKDGGAGEGGAGWRRS